MRRGLAWIASWFGKELGDGSRPAETLEVDVTELARNWLPYNREPWPASGPAESAGRAGAAAVAGSAVEPALAAPAAAGSAAGPAPATPAAPATSAAAGSAAGPAPATPAAAAASARAAEREALPAPFGPLLAPYAERCRRQGLWPVMERAAAALMEHGEAPSVVLERGSADREAKDLASLRGSLGRVTLRDHTAHVLAAIIEVVREQYREPESHIPRAALAALVHDVGKIPAWRALKAYGKQDHAAISAVKLREWAGEGPEPWWVESVVAAVRDHHRRSNDLVTTWLRLADQRAREREIAAAMGDVQVSAFPAWMDARRWREAVAAEIDMLQSGNQWLALTHQGVVYAKLDLVVQAARTVMHERRAVDLTFLADGERERAAARVVRWLKEDGWLADEIGDGHYGLPYDVEVTVPRQGTRLLPPHYLVPLKVERFGSEGAFRQRKAGILALVTAVRKRPLAVEAN